MECIEAFFGGAAGGGKSDALLMAALQFVDVPGYHAMLFRRTYADLALPEALMNRAGDWLRGTDAHWSGQEKTWIFPSGATVSFGYLDTENDRFRYQSSAYQFIGFDELTQFPEKHYRYLFSRLRRLVGTEVPLRMRSASNPGGIGHDWVKDRFVGGTIPPSVQGVFVPSRLEDNPYLDSDEYRKTLELLDPVTRAQLLSGDWEAYEGGMFKREWFPIVEAAPRLKSVVRAWDKAGTANGGDFSAGVLIGKGEDGLFYVADVIRGQWDYAARNRIIEQTAELDAVAYGRTLTIWIEQEPGSGGKESAELSVRALAGYNVHAERVTGDKPSRAQAFAAQAGAGNVRLVRGVWNREFLDEICMFPNASHDDMVDSAAMSFNKVALVKKRVLEWL